MPTSADDSLAQLATELRTVLTRLVKLLRTHSPAQSQLSLTERAVLRQLAEHPHRLPSELAAHEKVTTQAMSQILSRLAAQGYVERRPAPDDGRKTHVSLAATGRELLQTARHERDEWLHQALLRQCSAPELRALRQALPVLSKLVEND